MIVLYIVLCLVVLLLAVILLRTLAFKPKAAENTAFEEIGEMPHCFQRGQESGGRQGV